MSRKDARWSFPQAWAYAQKRAMDTRSQYFVCRAQDGEFVDFYAVAAVCADKDDLANVVGTLPSLACFNPRVRIVMKNHSAPYPTMSKSRAQIAEHIAQGFPSPVKYTTVRLAKLSSGSVVPVITTPIHLLRA